MSYGAPGVERIPVAERFWTKVEFTDTCWLWTAFVHPTERYGMFGVGSRTDGSRKTVRSHRWAYEFCVGPIPNGLVLDHLCRIRHCVNPDHLQAVSNNENIARGDFSNCGRQWREKTHCKHGHAFTEDNVWLRNGKWRICLTCCRLRERNYRAHKRSHAPT